MTNHREKRFIRNFDFELFTSILNSLSDLEAHNLFYGEGRFSRLVRSVTDMVFSNDQDDVRNNAMARIQALRAASCVKILGKGVIRVVRRVDDAKENNNLDLSNCQLIQVPDAVYFMMRDTQLNSCNLSSNVISRLTPKFPTTFLSITDLNLSYNKMSALPEEVSQCNQLETVDISHNSFISLPNCLLNLPKIMKINAMKNFIADVEVEVISETLEDLNLEDNPLSRDCQDNLSTITNVRILMTPREMEEWEDLSI